VFQGILVLIAVIEWTPIADENKQPRPRLSRQQFSSGMANSRPITVLLHRGQSAKTLRCLPAQFIIKIFQNKKVDLPPAMARIAIEGILISNSLKRFT